MIYVIVVNSISYDNVNNIYISNNIYMQKKNLKIAKYIFEYLNFTIIQFWTCIKFWKQY